jgi:hypothetical protein
MKEVYIGAKIEPEIRELVKNVARRRGENTSTFLRRALIKELAQLSFLPDETKKALGVETDHE